MSYENPTVEELREERTRMQNIHRCLDFVFGHSQENEIALKEMDRKELSELMYGFATEANIPEAHFHQAYSEQVCMLNGTPSSMLDTKYDLNQKHTKMKKVEPMLPMELQILDKKKPDEPTQRQRVKAVKPYLSPQLLKFMDNGNN